MGIGIDKVTPLNVKMSRKTQEAACQAKSIRMGLTIWTSPVIFNCKGENL